MFIKELKTSEKKKIEKINRVLQEAYGIKLSTSASPEKLESIRLKLNEDLRQLRINGATATDKEYSKKLLLVSGINELIKARTDEGLVGPGSNVYRRVLEWLADYAIKAIDVGDSVDDAVRDAMRHYRSSRYRFPDHEIEHDLRGKISAAYGEDEIGSTVMDLYDEVDYRDDAPVYNAILRRLSFKHPEVLAKHSPEDIEMALSDAQSYYGDLEEIGSSDVYHMTQSVLRELGEPVNEDFGFSINPKRIAAANKAAAKAARDEERAEKKALRAKTKKAASEAQKEALKKKYAILAQKIAERVAASLPDTEPFEQLISDVRRLGLDSSDPIRELDRAAKIGLGSNSYFDYIADVWDDAGFDEPNPFRESVNEDSEEEVWEAASNIVVDDKGYITKIDRQGQTLYLWYFKKHNKARVRWGSSAKDVISWLPTDDKITGDHRDLRRVKADSDLGKKYLARYGKSLTEGAAFKLNSKVKIHAPGKDYHGKEGVIGEIRDGAHKTADKTYTVDYEYDKESGDKKSVQLSKKNIKHLKESAPPGMESWIKKNKEGFKSQYGDDWQEKLYATAWSLYNKSKKAHRGQGAKMESSVTEDAGHSITDIITPEEAKQLADDLSNAEIDMQSTYFQKLFDYYLDSGDFPIGIAKARTGDPDAWIADQVIQHYGDELFGLVEGDHRDVWDRLYSPAQKAHAEKELARSGLSLELEPEDKPGGTAAYHSHMRQRTKDKMIKEKDTSVMKEGYVKKLRSLLEAEVGQAESLVAARSFSQELQGMVEKLGRLMNEDLPTVSEQMRSSYGPDIATGFEDQTIAVLQEVLETLRKSKQEIDNSVAQISDGQAPVASGMNDMDMDDEEMDLDLDLGDEGDLDLGDELDDLDLGDEGEEVLDAPDDEPLGRAKKESAESIKNKLVEAQRKLQAAYRKKIAEAAKWRKGYSASGHPPGYKHKSGEVGPIGGSFYADDVYGEPKQRPVNRYRDETDPLAGREETKLSTKGTPLLPKNAAKNLKHRIQQSKGKHGPVGTLPEELAEAKHEAGIGDKDPVKVSGVKGAKSTPFTKKFKNMAAYEKWLDANEDDVEVKQVEKDA